MRKYLAYYENEWPSNIAELTAVENKPFVGYLKGEGVSFTVIESTAPTFYNGHEYVDLGLPSGTKWATMNVGATSPEQEGVKYNCASRFTADAYEWGGSWSQPSYYDFSELINTCKIEPISYNEVPMCKCTGPNGKFIYLSVDLIYMTSSVDLWESFLYYCPLIDSTTCEMSDHFVYSDELLLARLIFKQPVDMSSVSETRKIYYTTNTGQRHSFSTSIDFGANILQNTYIDGLGVVIFDNDVLTIGDEAFNVEPYYASSADLVSIVIPDSVTSIGDEAFWGCKALTSIVIPDSVTSIGGSAFVGCPLTSITIPNGVTIINLYLFSNCLSLTSIVIPESVTSIERYAFNKCSSLASITFEGTMAEWNSVEKRENWNSNVPATHVQCTDGQVAL